MHPALNVATQAALSAGKIMLRNIDRLDKLTITAKQRNDFFSEVDVKAEQEVIRTIHKFYPDHAVLGEEGGASGDNEEHQWIIDPLDGTMNFLHGFPHFCVSIAYQQKKRLEVAIIHDPLRNETFTSVRGSGAQLNDRRIRVTNRLSLDGALVATGIPSRHMQHKQAFLSIMDTMMEQGAQLRRTGSAALDLAYVAAGRLDGFWEIGINSWDMAAGALLIQEAGGLVSDFGGGHDFLTTGNVVGGNAKVLKGLLKAMNPYLGTTLAR